MRRKALEIVFLDQILHRECLGLWYCINSTLQAYVLPHASVTNNICGSFTHLSFLVRPLILLWHSKSSYVFSVGCKSMKHSSCRWKSRSVFTNSLRFKSVRLSIYYNCWKFSSLELLEVPLGQNKIKKINFKSLLHFLNKLV